MKKIIKITESELNKIIENQIQFTEKPDGLISTVGELKEFIKNLPDDMKITNPDSSETTLTIYNNSLNISTW